MPARRARGEGTVYEESARNRWVGAVTIDGTRRKVIGKTKTEARKRLNALLRERDSGNPVGDGNATIEAILDRWLERDVAGRDLAPSTATGYEWAAEIVNKRLGKRRVKSLAVIDVEDLLDQLAADGFSHASLVKIRRTLSQALKAAERRGIASRNVAMLAVLPADAPRTAERRVLTPGEIRTLLGVLQDERLGAMYALMATVGLRPGEAAGLRWDALDLEAGTVAIRTAMRLEGAKPIIVEDLKTRQARRTLTAPPAVVAMLRDHRRRQTEEQLAAPRWNDPSLVFCTGVGTPLGPPNVRRDLDRILARADLPAITPNGLRHSAASAMVDAGIPLDRVAQVLGHSSVRMLEQTYQHAVRPSIDIAAEVMSDLLASAK